MCSGIRFWVTLVLLFASASGVSAEAAGGRGTDPTAIAAIDAILADPAFKGGIQGVVVQSLESGKVWYERNPDLLFMPASNQKLLTSAAALNALGPDWTYTTTLMRTGSLDDEGTLHGNLYLKGSGDPLLELGHLDQFTEAVKFAGIKRVRGKLIGDDSRFDRKYLGLGWQWDYLAARYAPPVSGLNINKNVVTVTVSPGRSPGRSLSAHLTPAGPWARLTIRGKTEEKGRPSTLVVDREVGSNDIVVSGTLALDAKPADRAPVEVSVPDPTRFATGYLLRRLRKAGIEVTGGDAIGLTPADAVEVARHTGAPLSDVLGKMNKPSDNLIAECLLKALGAEKGKGGIGTTNAGEEAAKEWFNTIGVDPVQVVMADGSGLSRHNLVTPRALAAILVAMDRHPHARVFKESLPAPGEPGTFRNRPIGPNASRSARVKSGYIGRVSSLSGYVETKGREKLIFVILMNNHPCSNTVAKAAQDRIVEWLAGRE